MKIYDNLGICAALLQREIGPTSNNHLEGIVKNKTIQNIAKNIFSSKEIEIQRRSQISHCYRSRDFLAIRDEFSTSLWNLSLGSKVWECSDEIYQEYNFKHLLVDKKGFVAKIYLSGIHGDWDTQNLYIEIFFEGDRVGSFSFQSKLYCLQLINGHIFGIGVNNSTLSNQKLSFYEYDQKGNLINEKLLPELQENYIRKIIINEKCFAIYTFIRDQNQRISSKIFIFNVIKQIYVTFDLGFSEECLEIQSVFFLKNRIIIASNETGINTEWAVKTTSDHKITIFNITTGKIEKEYPLNTRTIAKLIANEEQAVFVNHDNCKQTTNLFTVDLLSGEQISILEIPYAVDSRDRNNNEDLQFSLDGDFLTVCYPTGCLNAGSAIQIRTVIDLKSRKVIQKDQYQRFEGTTITFQSGILLISKIFERNLRLYVENFNCLYSDRCKTDFRI